MEIIKTRAYSNRIENNENDRKNQYIKLVLLKKQ